jgi:acetyltransferase-like isoleucine patch superfamily enzyme
VTVEPRSTATLHGGLWQNMSRYRRRVTGGDSWGRFLWQGFVLSLLADPPTIGASMLRGLAYRTVLGSIGSGCIIEQHVRLLVPRRIELGRRVLLGEGCFLDAHNAKGRIQLQDDVWLSRGSLLITAETEITIEARAYIGHRCVLYGHGGIRIGQDALLANDVQLICGNHTFARRDIPIRDQPGEEQPIVVEEDVWLGASAIVLGGVTIGQGAVVGAGSIVTHDLPPFSIARGVPARIVGERGGETYQEK